MGQVAQLIGEEALKAEVSFLQIPSLNLHRTAMGGRNCDSFSEDSVLTGKMAAAFCKGLSKKGVIPVLGKMVLADQETNYIGLTVLAGEQAIRELYLRPFEIALREGGSGMKAVMAGMNRIGPRWCGGHIGLLTEVLRNEWGFEGFVMTDQVTSGIDSYADILEGLEAGTDMWQNTSNGRYKLKGGQLTYGVRARFRTAAERILRTVSRSNAMNGMDKDTTMKYTSPAWRLIRIVVILLSVVASLLCLLYAAKKLRSEALVRDKLAQVKRDYKRSRRG
jgi:beta-glucosidase